MRIRTASASLCLALALVGCDKLPAEDSDGAIDTALDAGTDAGGDVSTSDTDDPARHRDR